MRESREHCEETLPEILACDLDGNFELLVRSYQDRIYGFALRLSGDTRDAEEVAQDAFVRAYRAMATYPPERIRAMALKAWLYQIALNVWRNRTRRKQLGSAPIDPGEEEGKGVDPPADASEQPEALLERYETQATLADLLKALPERYRVAVVLRFVQDLSYAEAARVLKQPEGTVKANVHRGIKLLRASMSGMEWAGTGNRGGTGDG